MTVKVLKVTKAYKKDIRQLKKQKKDFSDLYAILNHLQTNYPVPRKHKPHTLYGKWKGFKECHVAPDWLLIWKEEKDVVKLVRTGSHSELFKK